MDDTSLPGSPAPVGPDGRPVRLGHRAAAVLSALARRAGEPVPLSTLLAEAWPGRAVDPANVSIQVSRLRAALGDRDGTLIQNLHGRGYRLAAPLPGAAGWPPGPRGNLPHALAPLVGREAELETVATLLRATGSVAVTGLTGIGKTALALAAGHAQAGEHADGAWLVRLPAEGGVDARALAAAIVGQVGFPLPPSPDDLPGALRDRSCLLLLDGCEGLDGGALALLERLRAGGPRLRLLATSQRRTPGLAGETVRLPPLPVPEAGAGAEAVQASAAGRLFLDLARAGGLPGPDPALAGALCRRLGGVPLALEVAARMAALVGLPALAAQAADPGWLPAGTLRAADPRHRSLRAALDGCVARLDPEARRLLPALAGLPETFTAADAAAALWLSRARPAGLPDPLGTLLDGSLLEEAGSPGTYRLNPLVRAHARSLGPA